jgi:hypothetical protein
MADLTLALDSEILLGTDVVGNSDHAGRGERLLCILAIARLESMEIINPSAKREISFPRCAVVPPLAAPTSRPRPLFYA